MPRMRIYVRRQIRLLPIFLVIANPATSVANKPKSPAELRRIILHTQHPGAHGMGYSERSLIELSEKIVPADIPDVIEVLADLHMRVGVSFALASQCEASLVPTREAAVHHKMDFLQADEVAELVTSFTRCSPAAHEQAQALRAELITLRDAEYSRTEEQNKLRAADDARIQANGPKLLDPKQAATLSRKEREEVYLRSVKAMGLDPNGPLTPQQKNLLDRMYRTMVLGQPGEPHPQ